MTGSLFVQIVSIQFRKLMSYRVDFWINAVASFAVEISIAYFLWRAIFETSERESIGGFSLRAMVVYYAVAILLGKLIRGNERDITLATEIYEGTLTRYILYPANYFWMKYTEHLGALYPALVQLVLFGLPALLLFDLPPEVAITPASVLMTVATVAVANLLYFLILYPLQGVAFWADNVWTLNVMLRFACAMLGGFMIPLNLFPAWSQPILAVLPFQFFYYVPTQTLLGQVTVLEWAGGLGLAAVWCLMFGLVGRYIWRRGSLVYTGVGI